MGRKSEAAGILARTLNLLREFEDRSRDTGEGSLNGLLNVDVLTGRALNYVAKAQLDAANAGITAHHLRVAKLMLH